MPLSGPWSATALGGIAGFGGNLAGQYSGDFIGKKRGTVSCDKPLDLQYRQAFVQGGLGMLGGLGGYLGGSLRAVSIASAGKISAGEAAELLSPTLTGSLMSAVVPMTFNAALPTSLGGMQP